MLSGDNGILQRVTDAKMNTDNAQIKERMQLAYHSALAGGKGSYTKDTLMDELENEFKTDYDVDDSDDTNWVLSAKGQSITIPAGKKVEKKVVGTSLDWKLNDEKDTILAYIGENIEGDTFVIPNYVDDNKIISIGNGTAPIWAEKFSNPNEFMPGKKLEITEGIQNIKKNALISSRGFVGDLILPNSITNIEDTAFAGCTFNGKLVIPNSVKTIGKAAFTQTSFEEVEIDMENVPSCIFINELNDTWKSNPTWNITFGENVKKIRESAFEGFTNIQKITLGSNVVTIENSAFNSCSNLQGNVTLGNKIRTIGQYAFAGCTSLESITVNNSVENVGDAAFASVAHVYYTGSLDKSNWYANAYN